LMLLLHVEIITHWHANVNVCIKAYSACGLVP